MSASDCIAAMVRQVQLESGMDMIQTEDGPKPLRRIIPQGWENTLGAAFNYRVEPEELAPWPFPTERQREAFLMSMLRSARKGSFSGINFAVCKQTFAEPKPASPNAKPAISALSVVAPLGAYRGVGFCDER